MRVAVYYRNHDVRIEERPEPVIGPGEVLLQVESSGICGSDVMESYRAPRAPLILGHEVAGIVQQVGKGVSAFSPGDRVFATHHVPCGECARCRAGHPSTCEMLRTTHFDPGGFAERLRVPAPQVDRGMLALPDEVSFDEGSFVEPLACVVQAQRFARIGSRQDVLVIGAGLSGLLHLQLARHRGCRRLVASDIHPYRRDAAERFGADAVLEPGPDLPSRLRALLGGKLADRVVVCAGAPAAMQAACAAVDPGGTILFYAPAPPGESVALPLFDLWRDEITLTFSYAASGPDLQTALDLIRAREVRVSELITHRLPLAEAGTGFALTAAAGESLKVILHPQR